ncbi:MAG TPA: class I SAM-dependent methyltransferase, partial [Chloroflexia bacterium]|nr:class I SAM-dependent methyltransferase [Chloroflexia bacterium]
MAKVEHFYDNNAQREWERLERHRIEFAVTMRALRDYLPPAPARILDIGGGPGRYSIALAQLGYEVTLVDLSRGLLDFAREKAGEAGVTLAGYVHANVLDLGDLVGGSSDAVLLMGPLYHLLDEQERLRAVREARRVLRPGGLVFAAFITRYAGIRWAAKNLPSWITDARADTERLLTTGVNVPPAEGGFTDSYFAHPVEIVPLMERGGFRTLDLVG